MSRTATSLVIALAAMLPLATQAARAADSAVTLLHLGATGTVRAAPDLLVADLGGQAESADPATAQRQLDQRMQAATRIAAATAGVRWQVVGYAVDRTDPDPRSVRWTAAQTLHLEAADPQTLLPLVGRLQAAGLAVTSLAWTLSPEHLADAQLRASEQALRSLRSRADSAAATLGLKVGSIRDVTLGGDDRPRPMPMMRTMALPAAPQATRTETEVTQEASAEIALVR